MNKFKNPVLEGFAPDPSICAVGDDFYMVTSTFAYFPGIPIYHSKDCVNWIQIGNVLDRKSQLELKDAEHSGGIFAPCIRYYKGIFYVITTNVSHGGNFFVTATSPDGPWSEPFFLNDAPGIDPNLFFDDNGKVYYVGTRPRPEGVRWNGDWEVWLQEIDLEEKELIGVSTKIWKGSMIDVIWPEGPHIYKKDDYYYLLIAEGGTGFEHSITVARSKNVSGPYENNPCNPILTHRHLGRDFPIQNVGHGDLVEDSKGNWYLTCLASRPCDGYSNLGRETFLALVVWENDWPVINPGVGVLITEQEHYYDIKEKANESVTIDFSKGIPLNCLFLRNPIRENYEINSKGIELKLSKNTLQKLESPSYVGIRQESMDFKLETTIIFNPKKNLEEAGLTIIQNDCYSVRFTLGMFDNSKELRVTTIQNEEEVLKKVPFDNEMITLGIKSIKQNLIFYYVEDNKDNIILENVSANFLSTEVAGGFVGNTMGIYASSNDNKSNNTALFSNLIHIKNDSKE